MVCQPDGGHEADEELQWLRNGFAVRLTEENKMGLSSVCVTPVLYEDNGATFTCRRRNNATATASVTLNVSCESQITTSNYV